MKETATRSTRDWDYPKALGRFLSWWYLWKYGAGSEPKATPK